MSKSNSANSSDSHLTAYSWSFRIGRTGRPRDPVVPGKPLLPAGRANCKRKPGAARGPAGQLGPADSRAAAVVGAPVGSVCEAVLRKAACPVTVVPARRT